MIYGNNLPFVILSSVHIFKGPLFWKKIGRSLQGFSRIFLKILLILAKLSDSITETLNYEMTWLGISLLQWGYLSVTKHTGLVWSKDCWSGTSSYPISGHPLFPWTVVLILIARYLLIQWNGYDSDSVSLEVFITN